MDSQFPTQTRVVIVGGGIVGCSVAYHLAKLGWKQVGSLIAARSRDRMTQLRRTAAMSEWFGVEVQLIGPEAAKARWPLLRVDDVLGAAWLPHDGKVIPEQVASALAKGAQARGATVL